MLHRNVTNVSSFSFDAVMSLKVTLFLLKKEFRVVWLLLKEWELSAKLWGHKPLLLMLYHFFLLKAIPSSER